MVDVGGLFQAGTAHAAPTLFMEALARALGAAPVKAPANATTTPLPPRNSDGGPLFWDVVQRRRSRRAYADGAISLTQLGGLTEASQGITASLGWMVLRAAPSAGALYPLETYVVANRIRGLDAGLYRYDVSGQCLTSMRDGEWGPILVGATLGQEMCARAAAVFIWTAVFERSKNKYGQRAYRYVYLDAGHVGHAVALAAVAVGVASCPIAAFYDDAVNAFLGVDGVTEAAVYMTSVGVPVG